MSDARSARPIAFFFLVRPVGIALGLALPALGAALLCVHLRRHFPAERAAGRQTPLPFPSRGGE